MPTALESSGGKEDVKEAAMRRKTGAILTATILAVLGISSFHLGKTASAQMKKPISGVPMFEVDPSWPKAEGHFGDNGTWITGAIGGITVDAATQHVWVLQRPRTL